MPKLKLNVLLKGSFTLFSRSINSPVFENQAAFCQPRAELSIPILWTGRDERTATIIRWQTKNRTTTSNSQRFVYCRLQYKSSLCMTYYPITLLYLALSLWSTPHLTLSNSDLRLASDEAVCLMDACETPVWTGGCVMVAAQVLQLTGQRLISSSPFVMNRQAELICVSKCVHTYKDALFFGLLQSVIILLDGLCNNKAQTFLTKDSFYIFRLSF